MSLAYSAADTAPEVPVGSPTWQAFCARLHELGVEPDAVSAWREALGKPRCSALTAAQLHELPLYLAPGRPARAALDAWLTERSPGACSSCKARILWGRTAKGAPVPLDPEPVRIVVAGMERGGTPRLQIIDGSGKVRRGYTFPGIDASFHPVEGHTNHFATCRFAHKHRRTP